jgi:hypothetical protein
VAVQAKEVLEGNEVADLDGVVGGGGRQAPAVRTKGDRGHPVEMAGHDHQFLPAVCIPDADGVVGVPLAAPGGNPLAVS